MGVKVEFSMTKKLLWVFLAVLVLLFTIVPAAAQQTTPTVYATAQRFESGLMIWRSDTAHIWVLGNNGQVMNFPAASYSALPDNPIFGTPASRLRPIFGFGKVWGNHASVRDLLGWPTLPELGFNMRIQYANRTYYLTQLDGSIIQINPNNTWTRSSPPPAARIVSFTASPNPVTPGSTLTLNWNVEGTQVVHIGVYDAFGNRLLTDLIRLPLVGNAEITVPANLTTNLRLMIAGVNYVQGRGVLVTFPERVVESTITVNVRTDAVTSTITTYAAFQQYERGFMIWRADTGAVIVFWEPGNPGSLQFFPQSSYETLLDNPIASAPAGFVRPINGFGRVWGNFQYVRDGLGWATGSEQGYQLTMRAVSTVPFAFSLPDGRVARVVGHGIWRFE